MRQHRRKTSARLEKRRISLRISKRIPKSGNTYQVVKKFVKLYYREEGTGVAWEKSWEKACAGNYRYKVKP
jgi:hypothetical protein